MNTSSSSPSPADLQWGSFTSDAPWELDRADIRWVNLAVTLRRQAQAEVPRLTAASRMPPGARVLGVGRRLGTAVVPWMIRKRRGRYATTEASRADISRRLRVAAEGLGPTYIKL
ncbi:MAG: AarF/ABC1/UbiB kinase family protein, partial [Ilumatobacteraceae bacterium]